MAEDRVAATVQITKVEPRVATFCDCGKPIAGFPGILHCAVCGRCYSVARMEVARV